MRGRKEGRWEEEGLIPSLLLVPLPVALDEAQERSSFRIRMRHGASRQKRRVSRGGELTPRARARRTGLIGTEVDYLSSSGMESDCITERQHHSFALGSQFFGFVD